MRIVLIAVGSRGDIQPHIALAAGLKAAGHRIRFLAPAHFSTLAAAYGLEFVPVEGDVQAMLNSAAGQAMIRDGQTPWALAHTMRDTATPMLREATLDTFAAVQDADLCIMSSTGAWIAMNVAERLGLPCVLTHLQPLEPSRDYFVCIAPQPPIDLPGWINYHSTTLSVNLFWLLARGPINRVRQELFNQRRLRRWGQSAVYHRRQAPVLIGVSPLVVPRSAEWHQNIHMTGYWTLADAADYQPPRALHDFLESGPPPVYIGFGSMKTPDAADAATAVIAALRQTGQRGIMLTGWGGLEPENVPPFVHVLRETSHEWLFPRMAAVVHHGGAGTTAAGLRSGVPSIVVPFFADQPFWARRVQRLGVGPKPVPRGRLSAETLADAIQTALTDQPLRQRAAALGAQLRAEDGVGNGVAALEAIMQRMTTDPAFRQAMIPSA